MMDAASARARPLCRSLPEEIAIWEILVRLPPEALLRCHAVCSAWRSATSTREFLLAHHGRQSSLPIAAAFKYGGTNIVAIDHWAAYDAQLHTVSRLDGFFYLVASCDGLLLLTKHGMPETCFSICNPATRQCALIGRTHDLRILEMYRHRPTGECRLLLYRRTDKNFMPTDLLPEGQIGCYVFALGSRQTPRYIGWLERGFKLRFKTPALVCDSLHWFSVQEESENGLVIVFDTIAESFQQMRAPVVPAKSKIFEMDGTLAIYTTNIYATKTADMWVLQNYESEVWNLKYRIELPLAEITRGFQGHEHCWDVKVVSRHGDVLLLLSFGWWLLHVDSDGKLVAGFHKSSRGLCVSEFWLKQTLIPHTFFMASEVML